MRMQIKRTLTALLIALGTLAVFFNATLWAKPKHQHHSGFCYFGDHDVEVLTTYYEPKAPRGLPPGLAKKYARTRKLPPGWQKKMQPVPVAVEQQLMPLPGGYRRAVFDGFAIVYNPRTGVTVDVMALFEM